MHADPRRRRRVPDWLVGLLIAVVLVPVMLWVLRTVGAGDDPSFEPGGPTTTVVEDP